MFSMPPIFSCCPLTYIAWLVFWLLSAFNLNCCLCKAILLVQNQTGNDGPSFCIRDGGVCYYSQNPSLPLGISYEPTYTNTKTWIVISLHYDQNKKPPSWGFANIVSCSRQWCFHLDIWNYKKWHTVFIISSWPLNFTPKEWDEPATQERKTLLQGMSHYYMP
jgi:hypothetical protein